MLEIDLLKIKPKFIKMKKKIFWIFYFPKIVLLQLLVILYYFDFNLFY